MISTAAVAEECVEMYGPCYTFNERLVDNCDRVACLSLRLVPLMKPTAHVDDPGLRWHSLVFLPDNRTMPRKVQPLDGTVCSWASTDS